MSRGLSKMQRQLLRHLVDCEGHTYEVSNFAWWLDYFEHDRSYRGELDEDRRRHKEALSNAKRSLRSLERRGLVTLEIRPGSPPKRGGPFEDRQYQRDQYWATATAAGLAIGQREVEAYRQAFPDAEAKRAEWAERFRE